MPDDSLADALKAKFGRPPAAIDEGLVAATRALAVSNQLQSSFPGETFLQYLKRVAPRFRLFKHVIRAAMVLQRVADGELKRVIVQWPPRHGKSEQFSRLFTAYFLSRFPQRWVAIASYGAELAEGLSADAQENYVRSGGELHPKFRAFANWRTLYGGGLWACGVRGPAGGKGANLLVCDDPIKDDVEASSELIGRRNQNWWKSVWYPRGQPDGDFDPAYVVITTRWPGPGDLVGWLLEQEGSDEDEPERWHIVSWEAIREHDDEHAPIPQTCTREPDPREVGTALCEERIPLRRLYRLQKRVGPYFWASLYQQRPTPAEGGAFKYEHLKHIVEPDAVPRARCPDIRYWDSGASVNKGDPSVGLRLRWGEDGNFYVLNIVRGRWGTDERNRQMQATAEHDGMAVLQVTQQEPGSAGKDVALYFRRMMQAVGTPAYTEPATGSKAVRGRPVEAMVANDQLRLVRASWNKAFVDELIALIWDVTMDDQGECLASAYNWLVRKPLLHARQPTVLGIPNLN